MLKGLLSVGEGALRQTRTFRLAICLLAFDNFELLRRGMPYGERGTRTLRYVQGLAFTCFHKLSEVVKFIFRPSQNK